MATSRKKVKPRNEGLSREIRAEDEADILAESGAEADEHGDLFIEESKLEKLGAVDTESIRENRRLQEIADSQRGGHKGIPFNTNDPLVIYNTLLKTWAPGSIYIPVKRLTGSQIQEVIKSGPRSGAELYEALRALHGPNEEAEYQVDFIDSARKIYRGKGRITMPDARPQQSQGGPMTQPYGWSPQQYPPPWQSQQQPPWQPPWQQSPAQPDPAPQQQQPQQQQPPAQQQQPQQQPPAPTYVVPPPGPDPMQMMGQMFQMFQEMRNSLQPPPSQQQTPAFPQMPPPPPPHSDPSVMMQWMRDMWGMFQQMQPPTQATPQPMQPQMASQPQQQDPMAMMSGMIELFGKMSQVFNSQQQEPRRSPLRAGVAGYPGRRAPDDGYPPHYPPPSQQQARERSASEVFRESISTIKTAVDAYQELGSLFPQAHHPQLSHHAIDTTGEDDDSPVRVVDTGAAKLAFDKKDGTLRTWESGLMNLDKIFNFLGEQREALQKAHAEQRGPARQLPPGYVEVTEGYQPPPGFVTVPVDPEEAQRVTQRHHQPSQSQADLPPPPSRMPPPIDQDSWEEPWEMPE